MESLGAVDVIDADVVLFDPAGVRANFSAEEMERIIIDIVLCALVVEVHFLLAVKLALALVLFVLVNDLGHELVIFSLGSIELNFGRKKIVL